jgi:hypothetical protein
MNNNLKKVYDYVQQLLDAGQCLEDAIDWALEQLPLVGRAELIAACMADMGDGYE